jgi:hypothetical protein
LKRAIITSGAVILMMLVMLAVVGSGERWPPVEDPARQGEALDALALASGRIVHSQTALHHLIREPQNTWSNLAFVIAGAFVASLAAARSARLVGAALIAVGVGSFIYHASASRTLRHLDVGAMFGLFFAIIGLSLGCFQRRVQRKIDAHFWLFAVVAVVFAICASLARNITLFGFKPLTLSIATGIASTVLISSLLLLAFRRRSLRVAGQVSIAIALFAVAIVCYFGDRPGGWFIDPNSVLQGHALWHVFSAVGLALAVYVIEKDQRPHEAPDPTPLAVMTPAAQESGQT